jgi:hypothetical protein
MSKPLRVLMVEDSEDDALLLIRELKKGGHEPEYERVETAAIQPYGIGSFYITPGRPPGA